MASRAVSATVLVLAVMVLVGGASAQSCTQALISMSPCLNYLTGSDDVPSSSCCYNVAAVVRSMPRCICLVLDGDLAELGIVNIDETRAQGLAEVCHIKTPPICNVGAAPTTSTSAGSDVGTKSTPRKDDGASLQQGSTVDPAVVYAAATL